jgi:hypothetical protein
MYKALVEVNSMANNSRITTGLTGGIRFEGETLVANPLVGGALLIEERIEDALALPVPATEDIPAGFDAIFQFRSDLLSTYLGHNFQNNLVTTFMIIEYDATGLSQAVKSEIYNRISAAYAGRSSSATVVITIGGEPQRQPVPGGADVDAYIFRITVHNPRVTLRVNAQGQFDTRVRWTVKVEVGVPAGPGTTGTGTPNVPFTPAFGTVSATSTPATNVVFPTEIPPPTSSSGQNIEFIFLTSGEAVTDANIELGQVAALYQVWARLDFSGTGINVRSAGDDLFQSLLNQQINDVVVSILSPLLTNPEVNITPLMSLGGMLHPNEQLQGLGNFHADHVSTFGNVSRQQVLSICVNVGPGQPAGDLGLVRPFVANENFAYYVSEPIIRTVIYSRWLRDTPKVLETIIPVEMADQNDPAIIRHGQARVRASFDVPLEIILAPTDPTLPDAIRLAGFYQLQLLELWDYQNQQVQDLGELGNPVVNPYAIRIYLFGGLTSNAQGDAGQFLDEIARSLLPAIYRPTTREIQFRRVRGVTSQPVGGVFLHGHLS